MSSSKGLHRGFVRLVGDVSDTTFRRYVSRGLAERGLKGKVVPFKSDHNVCTTCKSMQLLIDQLQVSSPNLLRSQAISLNLIKSRSIWFF